jgi:hypothetical protein
LAVHPENAVGATMANDNDLQMKWVQRVLGVTVSASATLPSGDAMRAWQSARAAAVASLRALSVEIVKSEDPEARDAIVLVQAIIKNLTPEPASAQAVVELERYISTDEIIDDAEYPNPFGIDVQLRAPLLPVLATLRQHYESAER